MMEIVKLKRRKKRIKRIIFVFFGILIFFGNCLLSIYISFKFFVLLTKLFVSIFGVVGTILILGGGSVYGFIKLYFYGEDLYKDDNEFNLNEKMENNPRMMREKLSVINGNKVENNILDDFKYDKNNEKKTCLRIVNSTSEEVKVKKRVRSKGKYL